LLKNRKNRRALEAPPPAPLVSGGFVPKLPLASGGWGPQTQRLAPHDKFLATRLIGAIISCRQKYEKYHWSSMALPLVALGYWSTFLHG